jgi:hypothetical protein
MERDRVRLALDHQPGDVGGDAAIATVSREIDHEHVIR